MDVIFNCPKCGQELAVDATGIGEEISCPSCSQKITIPESAKPAPETDEAATEPAEGEAAAPRWGGAAVNAIASSAAAKEQKHLKVPVHNKPAEKLIAKVAVPLEVAAKESDRVLKAKTIRHIDCVEVGHDKFDEMVSKTLEKIGEHNLVSVTPLNYSHLDIASQKQLTDYGILIIYRG
jgi:DNA-directed RNA polymerase subunit RPC12/RpoP